MPRVPGWLVGAVYGLGVWAVSYKGWIPALGILPPPERDRPGRPVIMVAAHVVYGLVLGALVRAPETLGAPRPTEPAAAGPTRLPLAPVTLAPNDFTHLHVHSEFSLLDGLGRITELVDAAAAQGMDSMAITDHGALYGAVAFYQAAKNKGIKPIIGVETYVARRSMTDKEGKADSQPFHLILLAKDYRGYQNLCRLVTDAHIDGYYYKPRIDREHLAKYSEGLIGLSACLGGEVAKALEVDDWELARNVAGEYRTSSARTASSWSSRTTACRSSAGSTNSSSASPRRSASRSSSPTTSTTSARTSPRRTTCCCASGPATTSTRPAGSSSRPTSST